jgi:hypothetical protein
MPANGLARHTAKGGYVSTCLLTRLGLAALLFIMLPVAANAYTLVLRSGRHVTVPDDFKVTTAAVIYEASPGFTVTVWLSNVDIAATERVNAEPAGSFAGRVVREGGAAANAGAPQASQTGRLPGRRVVTNKELEPSRLRREKQEEEYERTRRERGMPSKEELQKRIEEEDRKLSEWARQMREERKEAELESLKYELVNVRRDLHHLNLQLSRQAAVYAPAHAPTYYYPYFYQTPVPVITVFPFHHRGNVGHAGFHPPTHARPRHHQPRTGHTYPPNFGPFRGGRAPRLWPSPATPTPRR